MRRSGDRLIGRSGDRKTTAKSHHGGTEARRKPGIWFQGAWNIVRAALCEIFDESAYDRFLLRNNSARSIASYRAFNRERDVSMQKKPRCC